MLKIAIDTFYYNDSDAYTVGVIFSNWTDSYPEKIVSCHTSEFAPYISGQFYKRELPCILDLLKHVNLSEFDTIILDGFVWLPESREGLGQHLWNKLKSLYPDLKIIGVSKSKFAGCEECSEKLYRGPAKNPLYINSNENINREEASELISKMHGKYKLPTLLKILDKETKKL